MKLAVLGVQVDAFLIESLITLIGAGSFGVVKRCSLGRIGRQVKNKKEKDAQYAKTKSEKNKWLKAIYL